MSDVSEKVQSYIESEVGQNVITLLAYTYKATKTTVDDEIVENASEVSEVVTNALSSLEDETPTAKEAKAALFEVLQKIADETKTKIDNIAVSVLKPFISLD